ncbi:DUF2071 domain-containing protein [Cryobacterium sp. TMT1-2-1]|uniref:YqjF family protein n=1 Tax=Cryobacterium sp. TMT1-2-1 TaxID=1259232 RepID=UPI00106AAEC1|nr:DUF2071 domain-containing protein [Cryobacterium sp. TMT1-2-1]TFD47357.1 DUF2071 domain-containing protein [Cryobacterium sp. TMT1-2-1]
MADAAAEPVSSIAAPLLGRASATQRWSHVAFLHWRVDAAAVAPLLPAGLRPDEFEGTSWVGLIPFVLDRATVFGSPPVPYFGSFVEVNVRLYAVDALGRRGVVFVSLEASRLAAVLAARALFSLPYRWSRTSVEISAGEYHYAARRHLAGSLHSDIVVRPRDARVEGDLLADFLTARWALFTRVGGRTIRLRNHHEPWVLYTADLVSLDDTLLAAAGFPGLASRPPESVLYSPGVTTRFGVVA